MNTRMYKSWALLCAGCVALLATPAEAVVLIDQFNTPNMTALGAAGSPFDYSSASGISPTYFNNVNGPASGSGVLDNARRVAATNNATIAVNNGAFNPGGFYMNGAGTAVAAAEALYVLDGTGGPLTSKPEILFGGGNFNLAPTIDSSSNINFDGLNGGAGVNLVQGAGDLPRGLNFQNFVLSLTGDAKFRIAVFSGLNSSFAYFEATAGSYSSSEFYIPFNGFDSWWQNDPNTHNFVSSTGNSADLVGIFQNVGAIVIQGTAGVGAANSFTVQFDNIYSSTPEPASFAIWGLFGVAAAGWRRFRPSSIDVVTPVCSPACI